MSRPLHLICASALLLALSAPAIAQNYESRLVTFGDLNLSSDEGADVLIRRIEQASEAVCGDRAGPRPLSEHASVNACETETTEIAIHDVGHPRVTARFYGYEPNIIIGEGDGYYPGAHDPYVVVTPKK